MWIWPRSLPPGITRDLSCLLVFDFIESLFHSFTFARELFEGNKVREKRIEAVEERLAEESKWKADVLQTVRGLPWNPMETEVEKVTT